MTTNNPDIQAFLMKQDGHYEPYVSIQRGSGCTGMVYPLVRLCDYEALQAVCEKLRKTNSELAGLAYNLTDELYELRKDAGMGRVVWKFIDRMNDVCPECDPADKILADFVIAFNAAMQEENK